MALVQVKGLFRTGLVQKVTRFVSPPNPSGQSSFLWKSDSFSMQKRALLMARMTEFKTTLFSSTQVATPQAETTAAAAAEFHTSPILEADAAPEEEATSNVTSAGTSSSETDSEVLERNYGEDQADHHKIAEKTQAHHTNTKDDEEPESLEKTGFDMSKVSRPSGDE